MLNTILKNKCSKCGLHISRDPPAAKAQDTDEMKSVTSAVHQSMFAVSATDNGFSAA